MRAHGSRQTRPREGHSAGEAERRIQHAGNLCRRCCDALGGSQSSTPSSPRCRTRRPGIACGSSPTPACDWAGKVASPAGFGTRVSALKGPRRPQKTATSDRWMQNVDAFCAARRDVTPVIPHERSDTAHGRRTSLRGWREQSRGGSSPPFRTKHLQRSAPTNRFPAVGTSVGTPRRRARDRYPRAGGHDRAPLLSGGPPR